MTFTSLTLKLIWVGGGHLGLIRVYRKDAELDVLQGQRHLGNIIVMLEYVSGNGVQQRIYITLSIVFLLTNNLTQHTHSLLSLLTTSTLDGSKITMRNKHSCFCCRAAHANK